MLLMHVAKVQQDCSSTIHDVREKMNTQSISDNTSASHVGVKKAMLRSMKFTPRITSKCKILTPKPTIEQPALPCILPDMMHQYWANSKPIYGKIALLKICRSNYKACFRIWKACMPSFLHTSTSVQPTPWKEGRRQSAAPK